MIIRLSVNDNDFYYIIKDFMKSMWSFWYPQKDIDKMSSEEIQAEAQKIFEHEDMMKLINPNCDKKLSETEQESIISYLKEKFKIYINSLDKEQRTKEYLVNNLNIKIQKSFTDKWENGEAFYWLQHSNQIINQ